MLPKWLGESRQYSIEVATTFLRVYAYCHLQHVGCGDFPMHRLTARILLTLLLVGTFTPVALAISIPPHACCMRKPMSSGAAHSQFTAADCCNHDCCRAVPGSRWVEFSDAVRAQPVPGSSRLTAQSPAPSGHAGAGNLHSGRSPPQFSIT